MSAPKYIPAALLLAIVAASATPTTGRGVYAISGTPVTLRYTFTPGEILTYQQTLTETARTIVGGENRRHGHGNRGLSSTGNRARGDPRW